MHRRERRKTPTDRTALVIDREQKKRSAAEDIRTITSCRIIATRNIVQGGTQSRQNYIPRNVDPKDVGAQDVITGAEPGGVNISGADRCVEEEAGRIRSNLVKERSGTKRDPRRPPRQRTPSRGRERSDSSNPQKGSGESGSDTDKQQ